MFPGTKKRTQGYIRMFSGTKNGTKVQFPGTKHRNEGTFSKTALFPKPQKFRFCVLKTAGFATFPGCSSFISNCCRVCRLRLPQNPCFVVLSFSNRSPVFAVPFVHSSSTISLFAKFSVPSCFKIQDFAVFLSSKMPRLGSISVTLPQTSQGLQCFQCTHLGSKVWQ